MKSISVVIPNYNGKVLFEKYFAHNYKVLKSISEQIQIIVVDDASTDDSVAYLNEHYADKITLIQKPSNTGFAQTCNVGIANANNDLIFLLNTDVTVEVDYFEKLYKYFELDDTFGVMGRIIGMNDDLIREAARSPKISGRKIKSDDFFHLIDEGGSLTPTFYLSGAIALMDTKKLKAMKGFNELFNPYYCEDQELSIRAWRLGWKCYYEHDAVCRHEVSASTKKHNPKREIKKIHFRNRYYLHYLHLKGFDLFLWHLQVLCCDVFVGMLTLQTYKAEAYMDFYKNRKALGRKKRAFKSQMQKYHSNIGITDVIQNIRNMLKYRHVVKL
jgi:GT2 family glycosyltransferase